MATTSMNQLRVLNAQNLKDSLRTRGYLFIAKRDTWDNETSPPTPDNSVKEELILKQDMLDMQPVIQNNCNIMVRRVNWRTGASYDIYRHDYNKENTSLSGAANLYDASFYVYASNRHVYVCLDNNNNSISTVEPSDLGADSFYTSDGYQWMRMFEIPISLSNHVTSTMVPITNVKVNHKAAGSIQTVVIENPGNAYVSGEYYCKIDGDGTGAVAQVTVVSERITKIRIIRQGVDYTYGTLVLEKDKVYGTLVDLDNDANKIDPRGDSRFRSTAIISPAGGWGTNVANELGATTLNVTGIIDDSYWAHYYRQYGILMDPKLDVSGDYVPNSGSLIYLANVSEVDRQPGQIEKVTLSIAF